jgi:hypothetical protein
MAETEEKRPAVERIKPPEAIIKVGNPIFGWLLRSRLHGFVDEHLMLMRFRGRKTGRAYTLPVGRRVIDGRLGVLTNSPWRVNFRGVLLLSISNLMPNPILLYRLMSHSSSSLRLKRIPRSIR